ncbi:ribosomal protein S18-alanine N-acetyltransferase [Dinoroseobacter sp. S76]|uniref:ribosomal protein S18-alanine N-acetyltransferase n=1 Tax=Dinoroseobacter sp. S76 TaxID=3415124 RepID=UPI003C7ED948
MEPVTMAEIHAASFITPRPWSAHEFADLLARADCFQVALPGGFAIGQVLGPEVELLTLAVDPTQRRQGLARSLMTAFHAEAHAREAEEVFLEVAAENTPARALYESCGYTQAGRRRRYYRHPDGSRSDALILRRNLAQH